MQVCDTPSEPQWLVVYTASRAEKKVARWLADKAVESFLPLQRKLRTWCDRRRWIDLPLIPSYVFVRPRNEERELVLEAPGVARYVSFHGRPAAIRDRDIEFLRRAVVPEAEAEVICVIPPENTSVVIIDGPFAGYSGVLVQSCGRQRVAVRIEELEHSILVKVAHGDIRVKPTD